MNGPQMFYLWGSLEGPRLGSKVNRRGESSAPPSPQPPCRATHTVFPLRVGEAERLAHLSAGGVDQEPHHWRLEFKLTFLFIN